MRLKPQMTRVSDGLVHAQDSWKYQGMDSFWNPATFAAARSLQIVVAISGLL